jgi:VRR-NUC domain-containing protein
VDDVVSEAEIQAAIQLALSRGPVRLFRTNAGNAWAGTIVERTARRLVLIDYRPVRLGVPGMSDLIGFSQPGAVYTAVECKSATGRLRPEQRDFIALVLANGGRAGVARSVEDACAIIQGEKNAAR